MSNMYKHMSSGFELATPRIIAPCSRLKDRCQCLTWQSAYNANRPTRPTAPARPMPTMPVGMDAAPDEEDETEPLVAVAAPAPEPEPAVEAPPAVEVPSEAREMTELFWRWMLARMLDWPALMAVELWIMVEMLESAVAFGAAVMFAELITELSAAGFVTAGTR